MSKYYTSSATRDERHKFIQSLINKRPYLLFRDRQFLPDVPVIYFVLDDYNELLYLGKTIDLYRRWKNHHRAPQMEDFYRIYWRLSERTKERAAMETFFIRYLYPQWNNTAVASMREKDMQDVVAIGDLK